MVANRLLIASASILCGCLFLVAIHQVCNYVVGAFVLSDLLYWIPGFPRPQEPFKPITWQAYTIIEVLLLVPAVLLSRWLYLFWRGVGIRVTIKGAAVSLIWGCLYFCPFVVLFLFKENKQILEELLLYGWVTGWMFWGINVAFTTYMIQLLRKMDRGTVEGRVVEC